MYKDHIFHRDPQEEYPLIVKGEGIYLYDNTGKRYLDACGGSTAVPIGHGSKEVAEAMAEQAKEIAYLHDPFISQALLEVTEKIAAMSPPGMGKVFLVSGGSEANESALKLTRQYHLGKGNPHKYKFIARWYCHHGVTVGAASMSSKPYARRNMEPLLLDFPHIMPPYCYRCPWSQSYPGCGVLCADVLEREILRSGPETVAAFITEVINGPNISGLTPPPEYYPRIREICDKYDVLFVVDEVMTGFGRTGANFAIDHWGVIPDIITFGKGGVSGGYSPLGGIIVADNVVHVLWEGEQRRFRYGHCYSGNPVSARVGCVVLDIIKEQGLVQSAKERGGYLLDRLLRLQEDHASVGDVRGKGLMVGVEFVKDKTTKETFPPEVNFAGRLAQLTMAEGVMIFPFQGCVDNVAGDEILITPPLTISEGEIDEVVGAIDKSLTKLEGEAP